MSNPTYSEIASVDSDITQNWLQPILMSQDPILADKGGHDYLIYEGLLSDDRLLASYIQRFSALTSAPLIVSPGGTDDIDIAAADSLRDQLESAPFDDITFKFAFMVHYGFSSAECLYAKDGRHIVLDHDRDCIRVRNRRRFRFDRERRLRLRTQGNNYDGELMPDKKFWLGMFGGDHHDDPYGRALGQALYWPIYFKRHALRGWWRHLRKLTQPTTLLEMDHPDDFSQDELQSFTRLAASAGDAVTLRFPPGVRLLLLEAQRAGNADYSAYYEMLDRAITILTLTQTMTVSDGSSLSQAQVHERRAISLEAGDNDLINQSFRRGPAKWLTEWNYPGAKVPIVTRKMPRVDFAEKLKSVEILGGLGFLPSSTLIRDLVGDGFTASEDDPIPLRGSQLEGVLQIVDRIQAGLPADVGQSLIQLAAPNIDPSLAMKIASASQKKNEGP